MDGDKTNCDPANLVVFSHHSTHMTFENYQLREGRGVHHLFAVEDVIRWRGGYMIELVSLLEV